MKKILSLIVITILALQVNAQVLYKINGTKITFPPKCIVQANLKGESFGKAAQKWDGKIQGSMKITNGIVNNQKVLLSTDEISKIVLPALPKDSKIDNMTIEAINEKTVLTVAFRWGDRWGIIGNANCPLVMDENGNLLLEGSLIASATNKPVTIQAPKSDYVGHVTLLK